jgi:hypothetical protein
MVEYRVIEEFLPIVFMNISSATESCSSSELFVLIEDS